MKVRIKGTNDPFRDIETVVMKGVVSMYFANDIEFEPTPDHWQDLRERVAIVAMGKTMDMLTHDYQSFSNIVVNGFNGKQKTFPNEIAEFSVACADALVKKLKGE